MKKIFSLYFDVPLVWRILTAFFLGIALGICASFLSDCLNQIVLIIPQNVSYDFLAVFLIYIFQLLSNRLGAVMLGQGA